MKTIWAVLVLCGAITARAQGDAHRGTRLAMNIGGATTMRTTAGETEWVYQWPAVYFEARFRGEQVRLHMDDANNYWDVLVDGHELMELKQSGTTVVTLDHLSAGEHTIRLEKRTETQAGTGAFGGFFVEKKEAALPPTERKRKIEFLGDSLTVGYGNQSAFTSCTKEEIFETTDANMSFGPLVAKHFNAEYEVRAFSGLGLIRNYGGVEFPEYHLPNLWRRAVFTDPQPGTKVWIPQVLVIGIGGNDFSTPVKPGERWKSEEDMTAEYVRIYLQFLHELRRMYPKALLVMTWTSDKDALYMRSAMKVFAELEADGISNIDHMVMPKLERTGCNGHPNIHDDAHVAELLEGLIEKHADAWQGQ